MDYGISVKNRFIFLDNESDEDPSDVLKKLDETKKEKPQKVKEAKKVIKLVLPAKQVTVVKKSNESKTPAETTKQDAEKRGQQNAASRGRHTKIAKVEDSANATSDELGKWETHGNVRGRVNNTGRGGQIRGEARKDEPKSGDVLAVRFGEAPSRGRGTGRGGNRLPGDRDNVTGFDRGNRRGMGRDGGRPHRSDDNDESYRDANKAEGALRGRGHTRGITSRRGTQADRHSGSDKTGVRAIPKKDGHGTGNWGDVNDELAGETEPIPQTEATQAQETAGTEQPTEEQMEQAAVAETKPVLTLSEFKAQHDKKEDVHFNTRKAGEGQDAKVYKNLVPLKKNETEEFKEEFEVVIKSKPLKDVSHLLSFKVESENKDFRANRGILVETNARKHRGRGDEKRGDLKITEDAFPVLGK